MIELNVTATILCLMLIGVLAFIFLVLDISPMSPNTEFGTETQQGTDATKDGV